MQGLSLILFFMGLIYIVLMVYSLTKQRSRNAIYFSFMCLSAAIFVFGYAFELNSQTLEQVVFLIKVQFSGLPYIPFLWFLFAYKFHNNKVPSLKIVLAAIIIPQSTMFFSLTNEYHNLMFESINIGRAHDILYEVLKPGPWYYVFVLFTLFVLVYGFTVFLIAWKKIKFDTKSQAFWLFLGAAVMLVSVILYILRVLPFVKIYAVAYIFIAISFIVAFFKYELLEIEDMVRNISFEKINEGILVTDISGKLIDFNEAAKKIIPWASRTNIGKSIKIFDIGKEIFNHRYSDVFEIKIINQNKELFYEVNVTVLNDKDQKIGNLYIFSDITKQKELLNNLSQMANTDYLTGLFNRRKFLEQAQSEISKAKKYAKVISSLVIDIDDFKQINDIYGHIAGDKVLKIIAQECKKMLRPSDIIGRYGGEEFSVILADTDEKTAYFIADDMRQRISNIKIRFKEHLLNVSISIGVSTYDIKRKDLTLYKLLDDADKALYAAKKSGKNKVVINDAMLTQKKFN